MPFADPAHTQADPFRARLWAGSLALAAAFAGLVCRPVVAAEPPPGEPSQESLAAEAVAILQAHCFDCHGPTKQQGGLRLDRRADAITGGDAFGAAIVPEKSEESPLIQFVSRDDADLKMPPKGERLSPAEVATLKRWIDRGANWHESPADTEKEAPLSHWSFLPIQRPALPEAETVAGEQPAIDRFIFERLKREELALSPQADRATLIRRVSFDLVGLPPTPEEVAEFLADQRPDAYERLVDRLLNSPHFGERWARHWLDVVRFAESDGFETNQPRPNAWPYRDYVIRSFNEDKPYDEFVREQLAGDLLGADAATGFLVAGAWDRVKSPDPVLTAQQRADELHDIVSTTGSAFLGLTVGCARCHSHKFDPVPQTDYYALKAVFAGVQHGERALRPDGDDAPRLQRITDLRVELASIERSLREYQPVALPGRRLTIRPDDPQFFTPLIPALGLAPHTAGTARGAADDAGNPPALPNLGRGYLYWKVGNQDVCAWSPSLRGAYRVWLSWGCGWNTHSSKARYILDRDGRTETTADQVEIAAVDQRKFADGTGDMPGQPLWSGLFSAGVQNLLPESKLLLRGGDDEAYVSADIVLFEEVLGADAAPATTKETSPPRYPHLRLPVTRGANVELFSPVPARWLRLTIDETSQAEPCIDELEVFSAADDTRNIALAKHGTKVTASSTLPGYDIHQLEHINDGVYGNSHSWISNEAGRGWVQFEFPETLTVDRIVWSRDRDDPPRFSDRLPSRYRIEVATEPGVWHTVATSDDRLPLGWRVPGGNLVESSRLSDSRAITYRETASRKAELVSRLKQLETLPMAYAGRFTSPEATFRFHRGDPTQPKEPVVPGALTRLGPALTVDEQASEPERRLALARWITDPRHPLTARVIVNRIWQQHFGEGLVSTPSDFGLNGAKPSHPELLDWLAAELLARNWSLKSLHRMIVLSSTYRQSSASHSVGLARDAGSRLLWRYPPRRLEAEPLRDAILAVCGNLDRTMGGPGFDLFEPNTNYVKVYQSKREFGAAEWRRMIYQSKPRMQLDDTFGAFDCPDAGQIAPKRTRSTTPLQALNLLNSAFMVQQSQRFAARLIEGAGEDVSRQIQLGFRLSFQREPTAEELAAGTALVKESGLAALCRALLNANEFLMVY